MKTLPLFSVAALTLLTGCVEHRVTYVPVYSPRPVYRVQPAPVVASAPAAPTVVVPEARSTAPSSPPPALGEAIPAPPGPNCVWVSGYWAWNNKWVWVPGRWYVRPHPTAVWVAGHWAKHGQVYTWVPGHWR